MEPELVFGLKDGKITHVSDVESGLTCGCLCARCGKRLIAKKGNIKVHHFAHEDDSDCQGAVESSLHLAAKEILKDEMRIRLPECNPEYPVRGFESGKWPVIMPPVIDSCMLEFDEIRIEQHYGSVIPDAMIFKRGHPLIIEIKVTHEVDDLKLRKIKELGISAIEIDLLNTNSPSTTYNGFVRDYVIESKLNKKWLYNNRAREYMAKYTARLNEVKRKLRLDAWYMHDEGWFAWRCPLGESSPRCCNNCQYLIDYQQNNQTGKHYSQNPDYVYCLKLA